jgi:hypothetical protein
MASAFSALVALFAAGRKITSPPWIEIGGPEMRSHPPVLI